MANRAITDGEMEKARKLAGKREVTAIDVAAELDRSPACARKILERAGASVVRVDGRTNYYKI